MTLSVYDTPEYRRSRSGYRWFCMLEYFISMLVSDVYLFKLLTYIGLSDSSIGIVSSLVTIASLFQLFSLQLVRKIRNVKRWVITACMSSQSIFVLLYTLPFLPLDVHTKTIMIYGGILLAYLFNYSMASIVFLWANAFVDPHKRAVYSAEKEMMSLMGGMVFTFILGMMMDRFELMGRLTDSFAFIVILGMLINLASFAALMRINSRWERKERTGPEPSIREVLRALMTNRGYLHVVTLSVLWNCAQFFTVGFLGSYKSKELMLSIGTVQLINIAGNFFRFFLSKPLGRYADRTSYAKCIEMALYIAAISFLAAAFASPSLRWFIVIFTVLLSISQAGVAQNLMNILYDYVPVEYFVQASSIRNCISGALGFVASLAGSWMLNFVQGQQNQIFGMSIYGQQLMAGLSFLMTVATALYVRFTLGKRTRASQEQSRMKA